jgi:RNA polymerase sigma-70 factor (ECF subfamily)
MSADPSSLPVPAAAVPEALLAESGWVRRLARRLVDERSAAEDLEQEAWARALEKPPPASVGRWPMSSGGWDTRAWLGGLVRNLARERRRERARREARERAAARGERLPSAAEALERLQLQRGVVEAVLALEEPYRSTVVLRFYEDLPPRRIAAREGVPVATVKTRLARGLAQLRARLDREHGGDGRSWALVLLPLAAGGRGPIPLIAGALAVNTIAKLSLASAALVGIVLWVATRQEESRMAPLEEARAAAPVELETPATPAPTPDEVEPVRESVPAPAPAAAPGEAEPRPEIVSGIVLDPAGAPVAGVALGVRRSNGSVIDDEGGAILWSEELDTTRPPLAWSGADGRYSFERPQDRYGAVVSQDERWETVLAPTARAVEGQEQVVVVAPRFRLAGTVLDESGTPLAGAALRFALPGRLRRGLSVALSDTKSGHWVAESDAQGRFALERLPAVAGARLSAELAPYEEAEIERELWQDDELEIRLRRPVGEWLAGVVEGRGAALAGAVVALGRRGTRTDDAGRFELFLGGLEREEELLALASGFLPAHVAGDRNEDGSVRWPPFLKVELAGEPLAIAGVVVDSAGDPLAGQEVWIEDGGTVPAPADDSGFPLLLETVLAGKPELRLGTKTDASGRFEIAGLEERDYRLRVIDPRTSLTTLTGAFAAGSIDARIVQPTERVWPLLRGVVVSRSGAPVPGASVSIYRDAGLVGFPGGNSFGFLT